jgi:hypothetical protein
MFTRCVNATAQSGGVVSHSSGAQHLLGRCSTLDGLSDRQQFVKEQAATKERAL